MGNGCFGAGTLYNCRLKECGEVVVDIYALDLLMPFLFLYVEDL